LTDEKLIQAFHAGSENAFTELVRRYESRVAATVIGMLGKCPEAEDVGQETFIRFYNGLKRFRGDSSIGTYLTRIAINLSLNELKRRKRKRILFMQNPRDNELNISNAETKNIYNGEKEIIHSALKKLDPKFRSVIVLRLLEDYSIKETAEILNIPTGTVLSRLSRAQMKLKNILSPYFGERNERKDS
jgi:RNA polymerase sigma-70 factor (ECF subfamily)